MSRRNGGRTDLVQIFGCVFLWALAGILEETVSHKAYNKDLIVNISVIIGIAVAGVGVVSVVAAVVTAVGGLVAVACGAVASGELGQSSAHAQADAARGSAEPSDSGKSIDFDKYLDIVSGWERHCKRDSDVCICIRGGCLSHLDILGHSETVQV